MVYLYYLSDSLMPISVSVVDDFHSLTICRLEEIQLLLFLSQKVCSKLPLEARIPFLFPSSYFSTPSNSYKTNKLCEHMYVHVYNLNTYFDHILQRFLGFHWYSCTNSSHWNKPEYPVLLNSLHITNIKQRNTKVGVKSMVHALALINRTKMLMQSL